MRQMKRRARSEPVISLINIVFLILIFFMVAGTLAQPVTGNLQFVQASGLDCCTEPDALVVTRDGRLHYRGEPVTSVSDFLDRKPGASKTARILPDRDLPATDLLTLIAELKTAGATKVMVLTETQP